MRIIIAGGRKFENYTLLKFKMYEITKKLDEKITVLCGDCKGADRIGEKWAKEKGHKVEHYPAKWEDTRAKDAIIKKRPDGSEYNVKAGHDRNRRMAVNADGLVAFWNGQSSGTKNMIDVARELGLKVRIIKY